MSLLRSASDGGIAPALAEMPESWTYLCSGAESDVYRLPGMPPRILRTGARLAAYERDAAVHVLLGQAVPVPEVYAIGIMEDIPYCISEELPGMPYASSSEQEQHESCGAVIALLQRIHAAGWERSGGGGDAAIRSGYGPLRADGSGSMPSWDAWMNAVPAGSGEGLGIPLRNAIMEAISLKAPRNRHDHALVHGDYGWSNTLVCGGKVTGVVDWSTAMYGDPLYDGGRIYFWSTWVLPCIRDLWTEYLRCHGREDRFWDRIYASALRSAVRDDADTVRDHAKDLLPWVRARAEVLLQEWKDL